MKRKILVFNVQFLVFVSLCFHPSQALLSHPYYEKLFTGGTLQSCEIYIYVEVPYTKEEIKAIDTWLLHLAKIDVAQFLKSLSNE